MRSLRWLVLFVLLVTPAAEAVAPFTGQFLCRGEQAEGFIYASFVQTGSRVAGTVQIFVEKANAQVGATTYTVDGLVDGSSAVLKDLRYGISVTARRDGRWLVLVLPRADGGVLTYTMTPTTEADVERQVEAWRSVRVAIHQEQHEILRLAKRVDALARQAQETAITRELESMREDLANEKTFLGALRQRRTQFDALASHATSCPAFYDEAREFYYREIFHAYYPGVSTSVGRLPETSKQVEQRLRNGEKILRDGAVALGQLRSALAAHRFALPKLPIAPEDAERALAIYQVVVSAAPGEINSLKAQHTPIAAEIGKLANGAAEEVERWEQRCY